MTYPSRPVRMIPVLLAWIMQSWAPASSQAFPWGEKHRPPMAYYAPAPMMPYYGAAPVAAAPTPPFVQMGAISPASAPTVYLTQPNAGYGSAPVVMTGGSMTMASAPTSNIVNTTTANAPNSVNISLPQEDVTEIYNRLVTRNGQLKKDTPEIVDRKDKLVDEAKKMIADKRVVAVDNLETTDQEAAEKLAMMAVKAKDSASNGWGGLQFGSSPVAGTVIYASSFPQSNAAATMIYQSPPAAAPSMYLYPVQLVPVAPPHHPHFWNKGYYP